MEKELKIQIVGDTKKFDSALNKLKDSARDLHWDLKKSTEWVDASKITKVNSELKQVRSTAKSLKSEISESHKLRLKVDDFEQKIKKSKRLLKDLDEDSNDALRLRLDISWFKSNLSKARTELNNFVRRWDKNVSWLQDSFNKLGSIWAWIAWATWVWEILLSQEQLQRQLISSGRVSAEDSRWIVAGLDVQAASKWIETDVYRTAYKEAIDQWLVWIKDISNELVTFAALAETKWYSTWEYLRWVKALQKTYWWDVWKYWQEVFWLLWWTDVERDIPNLLAEYAPLLKERWFETSWEIYSVLKKASELWTFNLDKPLDLLKEQWAKFTEIFTEGEKGNLEQLNKIFGDSFQDLQKQYKEGEISSKEVWELLSAKAAWLDKTKQLQLVLDVFWTQAEDLWYQNVIELLTASQWFDSKKYEEDLRNNAQFITDEMSKFWSRSLSWVTQKVTSWLWWAIWWWVDLVSWLFKEEDSSKFVNTSTVNYYSTNTTLQNNEKISKLKDTLQPKTKNERN